MIWMVSFSMRLLCNNDSSLKLSTKTLRDLALPEFRQQPFGGIAVLLGGDWSQLLPVIVRGSEQEIIESTHRFSSLWPLFQTYTLKINMRADADQIKFANGLNRLALEKFSILTHIM